MSEYLLAMPGILREHRADVVHRPHVDEEGDARLVERFIAGEDAAFTQLYDRYSSQVALYCRKMVGNGPHVLDLTQEIWIRIINLRRQPQHVANPGGLLFTIARNLCLNHIKARKNDASLDDLHPSHHPNTSTPELSEMEELIVLLLPRLDFDLREVLVLGVYCDYSAEEIASALGASVSAVRTRACRARAKLRRMIESYLERHPGTERTRAMAKEKSA